MSRNFSTLSVFLALCLCIHPAFGQTSAIPQGADPTADYTVGAGDEITISIANADEVKDSFANSFLVDSDGFLSVPMVGRIHAGGLTTAQLQSQVRAGLSKYILDPQVFVNLKNMKSQIVSVLGSVNSPGVHPLTGPKTLMEVLALAGGLSKDAGYRIDLSRQVKWGMIPLPGAKLDPTGEFSTVEVNTRQLTDDKNPADNILVKPNDVITVPRAEQVYVIGEVKKPGPIGLGDLRQLSVLAALSQAEGFTSTALASKATILRMNADHTARVQEKIDLKKVLQGKTGDIQLSASDILFIPDNSKKRAGIKAAETALTTLSGIIIWHGL